MSLLTIVQGAARRCNIQPPAAAIGSNDLRIASLIDYAQDTGDDLLERWTWVNLKSFPYLAFTGDGTTTRFDLPAAFLTYSPSMTLVSNAYPTTSLVGPINEEDLLRLKQLAYTTVPAVWRRINNQIEIYPAPANLEIISSTYARDQWITNAAGVPYTNAVWTADSDLSVIPERLIMLGTVWRWKRGKGLDYAQEFESFEQAFDRRAGQENTERMIAMSYDAPPDENFFPGTITDLTSH